MNQNVNQLGSSSEGGAQLTTTEELIVQYLDGELVRKELEAMLFERLAQSAEARTILREHLMLRGAIRDSLEDDRFVLTEDIDARTRARIEQMLESVTADTQPAVAAAPRDASRDAAPVQTNATTRRLNRWVFRPSIAVLLLLLTAGVTWYVTRTTLEQAPRVAQNIQSPALQSTTAPPSASIAENVAPAKTSRTENASATEQPRTIVREVVRYVKVPVSKPEIAGELAQNSATSAAPAPKHEETSQSDASDLMLSRRYSRILNAAEKHEVVINGRDRL